MSGPYFPDYNEERRHRRKPGRGRGIGDLLGEELGATSLDELTGPPPNLTAQRGGPRAPLPTLEPEEQIIARGEAHPAHLTPPRPLPPLSRHDLALGLLDQGAQRPDATVVSPDDPMREQKARAAKRKAQMRETAEDNFNPVALRELAGRQRKIAAMHREIGQVDEADELERLAGNAELLATSSERADEPGAIVTSNALGIVHDPYASERRTLSEARSPGMVADERQQREVGMDRPVASHRGTDIAKDYLYPMLGQVAPLMVGGAMGRAGVRMAGEALSEVPRARSIGQALGRAAETLEPPRMAGPAAPIGVAPGIRLAEEIEQFKRAAPVLMARGATEGQVVGGLQMYRMAREQGAEPADAFGAAMEGVGLSVPLGVVAELGFAAAGAAGRAGIESLRSAGRGATDALTESLGRAREAAERMAEAPPRTQANAVDQMFADMEISAAVRETEAERRTRVVQEQRQAARAAEEESLRRHTETVVQSIERLREHMRGESGTPEEIEAAQTYKEAIAKAVEADARLRQSEESRATGHGLQEIAAQRAFHDLNEARRKYGRIAGTAGLVALAAREDSLTDDEKGAIGLAVAPIAVTYASPRVRRRLMKGLDEIAPHVAGRPIDPSELFSLLENRSKAFANLSRNARFHAEKLLRHIAGGVSAEVDLATYRQGLNAEEVARATEQPVPLYSRLQNAVVALPKAWDAARPAGDWIGKLKSTTTFKKDELALLLPLLEREQQAKRKVTRSDVLDFLVTALPQVERITLEEPHTGSRPNDEPDLPPADNNLVPMAEMRADAPAHEVAQQLANREAAREHIEAEIVGLEATIELPEHILPIDEVRANHATNTRLLQDQIDQRQARVREYESEIEDEIRNAQDRYDEAEAEFDAARGDARRDLQALGLTNRTIDRAFDLVSANDGETERARNEVVEDITVDYDPNELLAEHGYTTHHAEAWRVIREEDGLELGEWETGPDQTEQEVLEDAREEHGSNIRLERNEASDQWLVLERRTGNEVARGDEGESESDVAYQFISDHGLDEGVRDQAYEGAITAIEAYANAWAHFHEVESDTYLQREDPSEAFERLHTRIGAHQNHIADLRAMLEAANNAPLPDAAVTDDAIATTEAELRRLRGRVGDIDRDVGTLKVMWRLARKREQALLGAGETPRVVHGEPEYEGAQRIGGGSEYRELVNIWANNPSDVPFNADHWNTKGYPDVIGHVRAETQEVFDLPDVNEKEVTISGDEPQEERDIKGNIVELRHRRDRELRAMREIEQKLEGYTQQEVEAGGARSREAYALASDWRSHNQTVLNLADQESRKLQALARLRGASLTPKRYAVLVENQTDVAQTAGAEGVRKPTHPEDMRAAEDAVERARVALAAAGREREAAWDRNAAGAEYAAAVEAERVAYEVVNAAVAARNALVGRGVDPHPFVRGGHEFSAKLNRWNANGDLAYRLNIMQFLADATERSAERIAWSDAQNRYQNSGFRLRAGKYIYDELTPATMRDVFTALGFKDIKIEHIRIRGHGHWAIDLTPEMRAAIRRVGLPVMGLLALAGSTEDLEAQEPGQDRKPKKSKVAQAFTSVAGIGIAAAAFALLRRRRAARLVAVQNPKLKEALDLALHALPTDQIRRLRRPDFAFPRREPRGTPYDAPLDVKDTPSGKGPALFNVDKIGLSAEGEAVWRDIVEDLALKKLYVSWQETIEEGRKRSTSVDDLLGTKPWSGTDAYAARLFQTQASERLVTIAADIGKPLQTPEEKVALQAEMDRIATDIADVAARAAGERQAAGRTLNAYKIIAENTLDPGTWHNLAQRAKADIPLTAEEILKIEGFLRRHDREALTGFISSLHASSNLDKWLTFWKAGLLTAIPTHAVNFLGNAVEAATIAASQPAAVAIDALIALARGTEREKMLPSSAIAARLRGFGKGVKEGARVFKTGVTPEEVGKWNTKKTNYKSPILQAYTDLIFNTLAASDRPFYHAALEASLDELASVYAHRAARLHPSMSVAEVKEALLADPPNELAARAGAEALRAVFQNDGALASLASGATARLRSGGKGAATVRAVVETTIPFTRTPSNVATRYVDTTPLGLVTAVLRQLGGPFDQRRFSDDLARSLTGAGGFMLLGYWLAQQGLATGSAPTNPGERGVWRSLGKQANSVKIGDRWYNVSRLGPAGMTIAAGAQFHRLSTENPGDATKVAGGMVGTVGRVMLDQSFLLGVSRAMETVADPVREGESFASGLAGSIVPAAVGRIAQATDDTRREAAGPGDRIRSRIPGISKRLRPQLNVFGEEMKRTTTDRVAAVADPLFSSREEDEPILTEMERLGVGAPLIPKSRRISDPDDGTRWTLQYTDDERHDALLLIGPKRRQYLERLVYSKAFARMPDQERAKAIRRALDAADDEYYARDDRLRIAKRRKEAAAAPQP